MITRGPFGLARRIERKVNEETEVYSIVYSISEMLQLDRVRPEKDYSGKTIGELENR
uniref:Uncharacterized protein n=1 Tax=Candidatus Kentrum sp. LFY TaxID=2126342 RepID=A0A450UMB1_9GAMM|nr:MAG: hypothetical protein BECKLFY1418B_GA0070995_10489 [Candidatus Kentron sp. LFY]